MRRSTHGSLIFANSSICRRCGSNRRAIFLRTVDWHRPHRDSQRSHSLSRVHFDLGLSLQEQCDWARLGSGSAGRSLHGGFVALEPQGTSCRVSQVLGERDWDLSIAIAITSDRAKSTGSTAGMTASRDTSPFYEGWLRATSEAFDSGLRAVKNMDFEALAQISEASCRQMHALMLSTEPALIYWNAATLNCIEEVTRMRDDGLDVFYTIDAGSHLKAVCRASVAKQVRDRLRGIEGVYSVLASNIGGPAQLLG